MELASWPGHTEIWPGHTESWPGHTGMMTAPSGGATRDASVRQQPGCHAS